MHTDEGQQLPAGWWRLGCGLCLHIYVGPSSSGVATILVFWDDQVSVTYLEGRSKRSWQAISFFLSVD